MAGLGQRLKGQHSICSAADAFPDSTISKFAGRSESPSPAGEILMRRWARMNRLFSI